MLGNETEFALESMEDDESYYVPESYDFDSYYDTDYMNQYESSYYYTFDLRYYDFYDTDYYQVMTYYYGESDDKEVASYEEPEYIDFYGDED